MRFAVVSAGLRLIFSSVYVILYSVPQTAFFLHGIIALFAAYFIPEKSNGET